jgi:Tfp pilus assembly protein PilN
MSQGGTLFLNLATRPVRNRRFYLLARTVLAVAFVALIGLTAFTVATYGLQAGRLKASLEEANKLITAAGQDQNRLLAEVEKDQKAGQANVDLVNRIIFQKSFSWTGFLSELEASLPDSIHITSFIQNFLGDRTVTLRIKAVSRGLDDLLVFLNNLNARKFKYRLENESREEEGRFVSEISLTYERDI